MKKAEVIQKLIFSTTEISLLIVFTSENSTFKYALYFINIFLYFINLNIIKKKRLFDFRCFSISIKKSLYLMETYKKSRLEILAV